MYSMFGLIPDSQRWGLHIPSDSDDHVNVGPIVLVGDVKEPLRATCTLAMTTLSANKERSF